MANGKYLEKASQQALAEALGYDRARIYYFMLNKQEKEIEQEFSYSKRYRLMKNLFELGAVGKIKQEGQDFFSYFILPLGYLNFRAIDSEIIEYLESLYLQNHADLFNKEFSKLVLKEDKNLILFILKYFMAEGAKLSGSSFDESFLSKYCDKIKIIKKENPKKLGIIDNKLIFNFSEILNKNGSEHVGYLARKSDKNMADDYICSVEHELCDDES